MTRPSERGVALFLVLVALVVLCTTAATLARTATTAVSRRHYASDVATAEDVRVEAERVALTFLDARIQTVVLPPDALIPRIPILDDRLTAGDTTVRVQITAFDLGGMLPLDSARASGLLRVTLSSEHRRAVDRVNLAIRPVGLDTLAAAISGLTVFPKAMSSSESALGAYVATHASGVVNTATAPRALLEAVLRDRGEGGLEAVLGARAKGERPPQPAIANVRRPAAGERLELAVGTASVAVRIDVKVHALSRAWWCVFEAPSSTWRCVERLAIDDGR